MDTALTRPKGWKRFALREKEKEAAEPEQVKKFRGVPENVKLFEVFWHQVVELIKVNNTLLSSFNALTETVSGETGLVNTGYHCPSRFADELVTKLLSGSA